MPITKGFRALVDEAWLRSRPTACRGAGELDDPGIHIVDIRDVRELKEGTVTGSSHAPRCMLEFWVDPSRRTTSRCGPTRARIRAVLRRRLAQRAGGQDLQDMGMRNVAHIDGGFAEWSSTAARSRRWSSARRRKADAGRCEHGLPCGRRDKRAVPWRTRTAAAVMCRPSTLPRPDAEALMRSRYSAFVLEQPGYLRSTWHTDTRPAELTLEPGVKWLGLDVKQHRVIDADHAEVEFIAASATAAAAPCACTSAAALCAKAGAGITSMAIIHEICDPPLPGNRSMLSIQ